MTLTTAKTIDCRGLQCPEPILRTAQAARAMGSGLLEILADDEAFPLDLKSWAASAKLEIETLDHGAAGYRALVRVRPRPRRHGIERLGAETKPSLVTPVSDLDVVDCRGLQCPQPIMEIAKHARNVAPGGRFRVLADDDAFPLDLTSWCRSSKFELISTGIDPLGVHVALVGRPGPSQTTATPPPAAVALSSAPQPPAASLPVPPLPAPPVVLAPVPAQSQGIKLDLRGLAEEDAMRRLHAAAVLGDLVVDLVAMEALSAPVMTWCGQGGHQVDGLATGDGVLRARLLLKRGHESLALAQAEPNRCALLVLHSDHEAMLAAMLVATGAASQGMDVTIFFSFWGLNLLRAGSPREGLAPAPASMAQKVFKWFMPAGPRKQKLSKYHFRGLGTGMLNKIMRDQKIMGLSDLMDAAVEMGVTYIACTMSMNVMGIQKRDLIDTPNLRLGGVAAFVERAANAKINMVF